MSKKYWKAFFCTDEIIRLIVLISVPSAFAVMVSNGWIAWTQYFIYIVLALATVFVVGGSIWLAHGEAKRKSDD